MGDKSVQVTPLPQAYVVSPVINQLARQSLDLLEIHDQQQHIQTATSALYAGRLPFEAARSPAGQELHRVSGPLFPPQMWSALTQSTRIFFLEPTMCISLSRGEQ